jgi:hypothetical protein
VTSIYCVDTRTPHERESDTTYRFELEDIPWESSSASSVVFRPDAGHTGHSSRNRRHKKRHMLRLIFQPLRPLILLAALLATLMGTASATNQLPFSSTVDDEIPKITGMHPEWFSCNATKDCGVASVTCGWKFAANIEYLTEARDAYCAQNNGCASTACPRPTYVTAVCLNHQCMTTETAHSQ